MLVIEKVSEICSVQLPFASIKQIGKAPQLIHKRWRGKW
ncbi:hypothetical protein NBRC111894_2668 [Sporolactobacillus inulinus]|uniref:Uncharacterized protein n=1 Tax=Sporolactobacillus inulinus TaxID=2078 RepID=A0A4Y1ZDQ4_9BACL|nr:hypothetical protein NBRC111894_2668 [Sporolactobacillus inulinus]